MVRLKRRAFLTQLGAVAMLTPLLAACQQPSAQPAAGGKPSETAKPSEAAKPAAPAATSAPAAAAKPAASGGELRVGLESDVVTLDPPMFTDVYSNYVSSQIHETLFQVDHDMKIVPMLAEKLEQPDDKTYVIALKKGVKFHNGEELTADDVKFTYGRVMDPATKSPRAANLTDAVESADKIQVVDKHTVKITLKSPFAPFLERMTNGALQILNEKAVDAAGADYAHKPVGTGPFKYVEWKTGEYAKLERNPDYWGEKAKLDKVTFRPIPDANTRLAEIESGGIDYLMQIPFEEIDRFKQEAKFNIQIVDAINISYMAYNTQKSPLNDANLRRAMNYAINKQEIVDTIYAGLGTVAISPLNPSNWAHNPNVEPYKYDPAKAKELLGTSAYKGEPLELAFNQATETPRVAERIQAQLKENLGINLALKPMEWGAFLTYIRGGDQHMMFLLGWSGNADPDGILYPLFHSKNFGAAGNRAFYKNEKVDELLLKAQTTVKQDERKPLYFEAQKLILDDAPWAPLRHGINSAALSKKVQGFKIHPLNRQLYHNVTIQ
jgi:peptide/nickel transport system substrate-binding protein